MRSRLAALVLVLTVSGCFGSGGNAISGPTTTGDQNHTTWQISDGLCGDGLFGSECDLNQHIATSASPVVQVRGRNGASIVGATITGAAGVSVTGFSSTTDDNGILLSAHVGMDAAGVADVIVLDGSGHEIDRAHITFVAPAAMVCGELRTSMTRDLNFPGLTGGPISVTMDAAATSSSTNVACRVNDASGNALLSVNSVRWSIATGSEGMIRVTSDDLLGSTPAVGATARLVTMGTGSGTLHAMVGTVSTDVAVTFH